MDATGSNRVKMSAESVLGHIGFLYLYVRARLGAMNLAALGVFSFVVVDGYATSIQIKRGEVALTRDIKSRSGNKFWARAYAGRASILVGGHRAMAVGGETPSFNSEPMDGYG